MRTPAGAPGQGTDRRNARDEERIPPRTFEVEQAVSRRRARFRGWFERWPRERTNGLGPVALIECVDRVIVILDPRAVVRDKRTGEVVYTPRDVPLDDHEPAMRAWLVVNPQWGRRDHN